ncbi:MAG: butyrate kinase [Candidatus Eisenbacteria bacterium]|nr:butyrate kinase [Candidatus Eisenbacteria bacterium]
MREREKELRILAINPGSTSTKIGYFRDETAEFVETIRHGDEEMAPFARLPMTAQLDFRLGAVRSALEGRGVDPLAIDAAVGRGGLLKALPSGTFVVTEAMLRDLREAARGDHASNLGGQLARSLADAAGAPAFIVDPVSVDEWPPVARLSGRKGMDRPCLSHALNTKATAKRYARERGERYDALRLVVAHLGSGISVSAHEGGRMIDVTNSREEGAFSTERTGTVPCMGLVKLCFSGEHDRKEVERMLFREGGLQSYLGTKDLMEVVRRIDEGDAEAELVFRAMAYQIAKEIGAMATVLRGEVNAILLTGGMAHEERLIDQLRERIGWIAPVRLYPGEDELRALAEGALRVLRGEEESIHYE